MVPFPLHKSIEAPGLGLPLTPSLPGETGCFLLAILQVSIHPTTPTPLPPHPEYTLTAPLWTHALHAMTCCKVTLQDCLCVAAASAMDFLAITRRCWIIVRKEAWRLNPVGTRWYSPSSSRTQSHSYTIWKPHWAPSSFLPRYITQDTVITLGIQIHWYQLTAKKTNITQSRLQLTLHMHYKTENKEGFCL